MNSFNFVRVDSKTNLMENPKIFDAVIIGGSYAGLSAAMSLGRARRQVLIIDSGNPCNRQTPQSHNFITHDGEEPAAIAAIAKEQVLKYPTVTFLDGTVTDAVKDGNGFKVKTEDGQSFGSRKLLFAMGMHDLMPETPGFAECWGISILHCPYCHGYEVSDKKTGIIGNGDIGYEFAKMISNWTKELVVFTDGKSVLSEEQLAKLKSHRIDVVDKEIDHFEHQGGYIQHIVFKDQSKYKVDAVYAKPHAKQQCAFPVELGCEINTHGCIATDALQKTAVPGVYAAGDCTSMGRAISGAVSSGAVAGMFINKEIIEEDF